MLPEAVLRRAADEMLDYQGSGQSVMEMSHRSQVYEGIIGSAASLLREVMNIPANYKVLFLQGGASSQFAMVPMNLMTKSGKADFVRTGQWATKAYKEAARYGEANVVEMCIRDRTRTTSNIFASRIPSAMTSGPATFFMVPLLMILTVPFCGKAPQRFPRMPETYPIPKISY